MFDPYEKKIRNFFIVLLIIAICSAFIDICGCSSITEPLHYTAIQYHDSEIVSGMQIYYVSYVQSYSGIGAFIDNDPPGTNYAIGMWIHIDKDFTYNSKKFHCKTIKRDYIEIAPY